MSLLASNLEKVCKEETVKEAFIEATPENKIIFRVNDKIQTYWDCVFENGCLVIQHKKNIANVHELEYFNLIAIIPTPGLPLVTRLSLESHRKHMEENLEQITLLTGTGEWSFEADFEKIISQVPDKNFQNQIGDMYYNTCLSNVVGNLKRCLQSEITKEAFNEATSERKIIFRVNEKMKSYWEFLFENGALVLQHTKNICNIHEIEYFAIEKVIPVPGVFSLVARLEIEKHREFLQEALEKIKAATGEEYSFDEACLETLHKKIDPAHASQLGSIFLKSALANLASNLEKALKDDMVKEAFNEVATAHQITFAVDTNPKSNAWWSLAFQNGVVVVTCKPGIANMHELEYLNIEKLL